MQLYYFSLTSFAILVIASLKDSHSSIISIKYIPDTYECSPWFTFSIFSNLMSYLILFIWFSISNISSKKELEEY